LLAVVEACSVRGAARLLNLSQAALTKALRELELAVGAELITRSYRGVRLTEAGSILHDRARAARQQLQLAETEIRALSGEVEERSEEHTSELQSRENLVCRLLLGK